MVSMATQNVLLKNGDAPTKVPISQQLFVLNFKILYQLNVMTEFYPMSRYVNYQICIFMNINENIRNKRKIIKNKEVYMQNYLHLSCLLSYTNSLDTSLMLVHSTFT